MDKAAGAPTVTDAVDVRTGGANCDADGFYTAHRFYETLNERPSPGAPISI